MFKNGKKTIGIFINQAELSLQYQFCKSLIQEAEHYDYNIVFFAAYEIRESNGDGEVQENIIVSFAPMEKIDVCIVVLSTFSEASRKKIIDTVKAKYSGPIISFKETQAGCYNILSGEDRGAGTLVRHLYSVHNARKICFFADNNAFRENLRRETYYRDSMEDCGLPVEEEYIFRSNSYNDRGEEAYQYFFSDPENRPDAVICADDTLARELCNTLIGHGMSVPGDTMVCGFNDSYESREFVPRLTTVSADLREMVHETIKMADDLIVGRPRGKKVNVPEQVFYRESCGCSVTDYKDMEDYTRSHYKRLDSIEEGHLQHSFFNVYLDGCENLGEIKQTVKENLYLLGDVDEFYLCLLGKKDGEFRYFSNAISENAQMELAFKNGELVSDESITFLQKDLLPESVAAGGERKIYYISLLHNREKIFGYTALNFKNRDDRLNFFYHDWNVTIGLAVNEYFSGLQLKDLLKKNEESSITDYLTGLPNRRGLNRYVQGHWDHWVSEHTGITFMTVDLDGLKYINDNFGHEEGDWAINEAAIRIRQTVEMFGMAARTGGDEFVVVMKADQKKAAEIEEELYARIAAANKSSGRKFMLGASIGSFYQELDQDSSYEECVKKSDEAMYQIKVQHHKQRK